MSLSSFRSGRGHLELLKIISHTLGDSILFYRVEKHLLACVKIQSNIMVLTIVHANRDLVPLLHDLLPSVNAEVALILNKVRTLKITS